MAVYATQYNNFLPMVDCSSNGHWLTDEPIAFGDILMAMDTSKMTNPNSIRRLFFCPSNLEQNIDAMWLGPKLDAKYRSFGYNFLNSRYNQGAPALPTVNSDGISLQTTPGRSPPVRFLTRMLVSGNTSDTELAFDEIISDQKTNSIFIYPIIATNNNTTNHVTGRMPSGGNVLGCDGHVGWRRFATSMAVYYPTTDGLTNQWIPAP